MAATTFTELWAELKAEATAAWASVKGEVTIIEHNIVPVVESDIATILSQLKAAAVNTVMTLAQQEFANLTGTQKNTITVNTIVQSAIASGKTILTQDAAVLAQQAYQAVATTRAAVH